MGSRVGEEPKTSRKRRFGLLGLGAGSLAVFGLIAPSAVAALPAQEGEQEAVPITAPAQESGQVPVTVMARNLYLGSDVGEALALLPDLAAAGQFMWDEVQATNFPARAPLLAAEAAAARPAVIGLQEATTWNCTTGLFGDSVAVYDFTRDFIAATEAVGVPYVIAAADGKEAFNPGYSIGPIPRLTMVDAPETFQPIFGSDSAACGFQISDALLVRADLADKVVNAGTTEYDDAYAIVPWLFEIQRGYAWADIDVDGAVVRFVATHLESLWDENKQNLGPNQARQIVADLADTELPIVVIGDFNNDPRDPRPTGGLNPGGQPEAGDVCEEQVANPTAQNALAQCNAYWVMVQAGYTDVGPDALDPAYYSWGSNALLAGPDIDRLPVALEMGNDYGWTDRLDYVFVKNGVEVQSAEIIGNVWPAETGVWECDDALQVSNTEAASAALAQAGKGEPITGRGVCLPTDHAGIVAQLLVTPVSSEVVVAAAATAPDENKSWFNKQLAGLIAVGLLLLGLLALALWLLTKLFKLIFGRGKKNEVESAERSEVTAAVGSSSADGSRTTADGTRTTADGTRTTDPGPDTTADGR